jgi:hypothetical protein
MKLFVFRLAAFVWLSTLLTVAIPVYDRGNIVEGGDFFTSDDSKIVEAFNATSLAPIKREFLPGKYAFDIRIGPTAQNVGTLRGDRIYDAIHNCLSVIGSPNKNGPRDWCALWDPDCSNNCQFRVVYDKSPQDTYATDYVQVATSWIGIKESEHTGLRAAAVSQSAHPQHVTC